jgi:ArsR family transcriptional regulator, arsenate/arsenite/antimonite-responsive transcriptional repressor
MLEKRQATRMVLRCRALGDRTRLAILAILRDGERCVCELTDSLDVSQPLLSFHLRVLRNAGLITDRRSGKWVYYTLDRDSMLDMEQFITNLRTPRPKVTSSRCCD